MVIAWVYTVKRHGHPTAWFYPVKVLRNQVAWVYTVKGLGHPEEAGVSSDSFSLPKREGAVSGTELYGRMWNIDLEGIEGSYGRHW